MKATMRKLLSGPNAPLMIRMTGGEEAAQAILAQAIKDALRERDGQWAKAARNGCFASLRTAPCADCAPLRALLSEEEG